MNKKGFICIIFVLIAIIVISIMHSMRECDSNQDCSGNSYCGSDFKCHLLPTGSAVAQTKGASLIPAALILGLSLIITVALLKWNNLCGFSLKKSKKTKKKENNKKETKNKKGKEDNKEQKKKPEFNPGKNSYDSEKKGMYEDELNQMQ